VAIGVHDHYELSTAQQDFNTRDTGTVLGLPGFANLKLTIVGIKVRMLGDAVLDSDTPMPRTRRRPVQ
jgi:hypothetical protein